MTNSSASCSCCQGTQAVTPQPTANRPGLSALTYRVGTHATFLETMRARLSSFDYPQLTGLKTRDPGDLAMALLDGWATVADVLTFYQERIANEGYLHTATERRSILELARLVGYTLRPGVSSSVYLAYTLDDHSIPVELPAGTRAQSIPGPGELPQSFETSEPLKARAQWNNLRPRTTRPQQITRDGIAIKDTIYFDGTATNLKANDPLLFVLGGSKPILRYVKTVEVQFAENRSKVTLQGTLSPALPGGGQNGAGLTTLETLQALVKPLSRPPSLQPANSLRLSRSAGQEFAGRGDTLPQLLTAFQPRIAETAYQAWANATVTPPSTVEVYALRVTAPLFGANAPRPIMSMGLGRVTIGEWPLVEGQGGTPPSPHEEDNAVHLAASYDKILPESWIVVDTSSVDRGERKTNLLKDIPEVLFARARHPNASISRAEYGITGKTTRIELANPDSPLRTKRWIDLTQERSDPDNPGEERDFQIIRRTIVHAQSELLHLAEEPIEKAIGFDKDDPEKGKQVELSALYDSLQSGRWVIVAGERTDIPGTTGVRASELVMLAGVIQDFDPKLPGDKVHTTLMLANEGLKYTYKRDTVTIYGNVVKATHGETRNEVLGSGDGSKMLQSFTLKQPPLTYTSAATPAGTASTLHVRVNNVEWHETGSLAGLGPNDRNFITRTDDEAKTTLVFGNGERGARLPTGIENITSVYRNGIGKGGNVKAEQISLLAMRPLGVKAVINPLRASGGADKESHDQARRNTPLAVMALDRLVSTEDYAAFARTFAGIGKASATRLSDGHRQLVHVTVAGADDIPIDEASDLYHNLCRALRDYGDPYVPIEVRARELLALVISAKVRVRADYQWDSTPEIIGVRQLIGDALLDAFRFEQRALGQSVFLSEVISVIQQVRGVAYVDVDVLQSLSETEITDATLLKDKLKKLEAATEPEPYIPAELARVNPRYDPKTSTSTLRIFPAQLAYLTPDVPATLILNEVTP
jgi:hypothetical protein